MEPQEVLLEYKHLAEKNPQLNVGAFDKIYNKLKVGIKNKKILEKILGVYLSYKSMRDGCEINSETFRYAVPEFTACLN